MEKNRLLWACRRGMLELDLVLLPFVESHYDGLEQADKDLFCQLLECEDQDLFAWFIHRQSPQEADLAKIVEIIRSTNRGA